MTIVEKVPTMSDEHLANLLVNARRMQSTGTAPQQATANEVVAAAEAEVAVRRVAHLEALAAKRAAAPKKPTKKQLAADKAAADLAAAEVAAA